MLNSLKFALAAIIAGSMAAGVAAAAVATVPENPVRMADKAKSSALCQDVVWVSERGDFIDARCTPRRVLEAPSLKSMADFFGT